MDGGFFDSTRDAWRGDLKLDISHQSENTSAVADARRRPRFKLEVEICVYPRNSEVIRGHTVDISESGISALLRVEVSVGEMVRLTFSLPAGKVEVYATVRQRNAFRYGFQFVEATSEQDVIGQTCHQLAVRQLTTEPEKH